MLKLHPECHNFAKFTSDRCPFISVCNEDCVYVWKAYYDSQKEQKATQSDIDELEEKISDLQSELNSMEEDKNNANYEAEQWESKYNELLDELARIMNDDSIEKLCNYRDDGKVGEWAEEVCSRRIKL